MARVTVLVALERTGAGGGPDFGAQAANPTTVAAGRGDVVGLDGPAEAIAELDRDDRESGRQGSRGGRSARRVAQLRRDLGRARRGAHRRRSDALELTRFGSRAELGP